MVLWYKANHKYNGHDFATVSRLYLNRYPNPFASHVISTDVIDVHVNDQGKLVQTKLICKKGRTPKFLTPFLGNIDKSWIIEKTEIDPQLKQLMCYTRNLDHTRILRIEEYTHFQEDQSGKMLSRSFVKFSSGFRILSIKDRIENWSLQRFGENLKRSRQGLKFVIENFHAQSRTDCLGLQ